MILVGAIAFLALAILFHAWVGFYALKQGHEDLAGLSSIVQMHVGVEVNILTKQLSVMTQQIGMLAAAMTRQIDMMEPPEIVMPKNESISAPSLRAEFAAMGEDEE